MVNADGKVAIEGLTLKLAEDEYLFTQSAGLKWLEFLREKTGMKVTLEDVTPDYTCYALQGPRSTEVLEALTKETWRDLRFSRFRKTSFEKTEVIVARQGVTGEIGYEFLMRTDTGRAHELWRRLREVGRDFGLRELGFKAQMIGHTETGIATVIRDFLPARGTPEQLRRMMRHWMSVEELECIDYSVEEHFCSPAELGWAYTINLDKGDFHGRDALLRERDQGGPRAAWSAWNGRARTWRAARRAVPRCALGAAARPADRPVPRVLPESPRGRLGLGLGLQSEPAPHDFARESRPRDPSRHQSAGAWGGFSDEPRVNIRAKVVELPFVARNREKALRYPSSIFPEEEMTCVNP